MKLKCPCRSHCELLDEIRPNRRGSESLERPDQLSFLELISSHNQSEELSFWELGFPIETLSKHSDSIKRTRITATTEWIDGSTLKVGSRALVHPQE
jgi:hypothetical protein